MRSCKKCKEGILGIDCEHCGHIDFVRKPCSLCGAPSTKNVGAKPIMLQFGKKILLINPENGIISAYRQPGGPLVGVDNLVDLTEHLFEKSKEEDLQSEFDYKPKR